MNYWLWHIRMTYAGPFTSHIARKCCRVTKTNLYRISDRNIHKFMFQICLLASSVARDLKGLAWCCGGTNCTGRDLATTQCKPPPCIPNWGRSQTVVIGEEFYIEPFRGAIYEASEPFLQRVYVCIKIQTNPSNTADEEINIKIWKFNIWKYWMSRVVANSLM